MKIIRRKFLKLSLGLISAIFLFKPINHSKNYLNKKYKVYKKKFAKVWMLDINDS